MGTNRWSLRARRQWRLFNAEPPVVRVTAAGAALVLLIGVLAAVGHSDGKKGPQGIATRGRAGVGASSAGPNASTASDGASAGGPSGASATGRAAVGGNGSAAPPVGTGVAPDGTPLTASDKGVTSTKIHLVLPRADLGPIGQATGLTTPEDEALAITAFVKDINDNGGINGRQIEAEVVKFNPLDDADMTSKCKDWTSSNGIFAIVDAYGWHDDHQLCITETGHMPLISKWTTVTDWTDRGKPYLWWTGPDQVEVIDNLVGASADLLRSQKILPDGKGNYAVMAGDRAGDVLALKYLQESLARAGVPVPEYIDSVPFSEQAATAVIPSFVGKYHLNNVRVVLPLVSFLSLLQFVQVEDSQYNGSRTDDPQTIDTPPQLLLSDYESEIQAMLGFAETPYRKELQNTVGPTAFRLGDQESPPGYTPLGLHCSDVIHAYDPSFPGNLEGPGADMTWCQNIYLFAQAARMAGNNLTRDGFNNAMGRIQGFGGAVVPDLTYGPNVYAGPHRYRTVEIHENKKDGQFLCPYLQSDGNPQGSCWLILNDFGPAQHT